MNNVSKKRLLSHIEEMILRLDQMAVSYTHLVGKPILVWLSLDKDRSLFDGGIGWNRLFRWVHPD